MIALAVGIGVLGPWSALRSPYLWGGVALAVLLVGPPLFAVAVVGFVELWRRPQWRPVRGLALAYLVALAINFVAGGQVYYAFGLLAFLLAAGWASDRGRRTVLVAAVVVNGLSSAAVALPLLPLSEVGVPSVLNPTIGDQVGWPTYVATLRTALSPCAALRAAVGAGCGRCCSTTTDQGRRRDSRGRDAPAARGRGGHRSGRSCRRSP